MDTAIECILIETDIFCPLTLLDDMKTHPSLERALQYKEILEAWVLYSYS